MTFPLAPRLRRLVGRAVRRFSARALILLYHRVDEAEVDAWGLCVAPHRFTEHLQVLRRRWSVVPLHRLAAAHAAGRLPSRTVAVTFDDGYADNLRNARPLLERYAVPATVFVVSGQLGGEFYWHVLERVFLESDRLPARLELRVRGQRHAWELGAATDYTAADRRRDRALRAWDGRPGTRLGLYHAVWQLLQPLAPAEQDAAVDELLAWAGGALPEPPPGRRTVLPHELHALVDGELIEAGVHGERHLMLSAQPVSRQRQDILRGKAELETVLGRPLHGFSYPYGQYSATTTDLVREAGFDYACSVRANVVQRHSSRFELPRFEVLDWSGEEFERRLAAWHDGVGS